MISTPLISIIIPCYNHGRYLKTAIDSCLALAWDAVEIVVVDDGSTDNTREVAAAYPSVKYVYKQNGGLPAARNTGIENCTGEYVSFLDADDWYYPQSLATNLKLLIDNPEAAFISGCHNILWEDGTYFSHCYPINKDFYIHLLHTNFIGNPSTVVYRRDILDQFRFDTSPDIKGCEDYDHYLRIARDHKVLHNPVKISVYRKHPNNMSNNYALMLNSALNVLLRQKPLLRTREEHKAWQEGWRQWEKFYGYFPIRTPRGRRLGKEHMELIRKYNLRLPLILWKKMLVMAEPRKVITGSAEPEL